MIRDIFKDKHGHYSTVKIVGGALVLAVVGPAVLSIAAIPLATGMISTGTAALVLGGATAVGTIGVVALKRRTKAQYDLDFAKPEKIFGSPSRTEKREDRTQSVYGRCYINYRTLVPKISDAYRYSMLKGFSPTELRMMYTADQQKEALATKTVAQVKMNYLKLAQDQLRAMDELNNAGDLNRPVTAEYWDDASKSIKTIPNVPYKFVVAAQRKALMDIIELERQANMVPLSEYNGTPTRSVFLKDQSLANAAPGEKKDAFAVAAELHENGPWSQKSPRSSELAVGFYNYTVSHVANLINNDKANAFDWLFTAPTAQEQGEICRIYSDACHWGLVDRQTRALIAQRAEMLGQQTGNYALYNFCMYTVADDKMLTGVNPYYSGAKNDFQASANNFVSSLLQGSVVQQGKAPSACSGLLAQATAPGDSQTKAIDTKKAEAMKEIYGLGTENMAANFNVLAGLREGIFDEALLGRLGTDKIKMAWQNPKTRIFPVQGAVKDITKLTKWILDMARGG